MGLLVVVYFVVILLYVFYVAHLVAIRKMESRALARIDEMNGRPLLEKDISRESLPTVTYNEVLVSDVWKIGKEEEDCVICLKTLLKSRNVETLCGHIFHLKCL